MYVALIDRFGSHYWKNSCKHVRKYCLWWKFPW